jgi:hypothetical protein
VCLKGGRGDRARGRRAFKARGRAGTVVGAQRSGLNARS